MSILSEICVDHLIFPEVLQLVGFNWRGDFLTLVEDFERDSEIFPITFAWRNGVCIPYARGAIIRHEPATVQTLDDIRSFMYDVYKKCISLGYKIYRPDLDMYNPYVNVVSKQHLIDYIKQKTNFHE